MKRFVLSSTLCCLSILGSPPAWAFDESKQVTVTGQAEIGTGGEAAARDVAIKNAQRMAIEEVLGTLIESEFTAEQKEILRPGGEEQFSSAVQDKVLTKSKGFIQQQKILAEKKEGTTYRVTLRVVVSAHSLQEQLASLDTLLASMGFPKILVLAGEQYTDDKDQTRWLPSDVTARLVEEGLLRYKMELVAKSRAATLARAGGEGFARVLRDASAAAALGAEVGAEVVIAALTNVRYGSYNDFGNKLYYISATTSIQAVQSGTGKILASFSRKGRGVGISAAEAREDAIKKAGPKLVEALVGSLVRAWQAERKRGPLVITTVHPKIAIKHKRKETALSSVSAAKTLAFPLD